MDRFLDEEIGTLCSPCSLNRGLERGWGVGYEPRSGPIAYITRLQSPYSLIVSRFLTEIKKIPSTLPLCPLWRKCY